MLRIPNEIITPIKRHLPFCQAKLQDLNTRIGRSSISREFHRAENKELDDNNKYFIHHLRRKYGIKSEPLSTLSTAGFLLKSDSDRSQRPIEESSAGIQDVLVEFA